MKSVSQAKGLIERDNGTFQDRLVSKLRLNNITTFDGEQPQITAKKDPKHLLGVF